MLAREVVRVLDFAAQELSLFAATMILVGGISDLVIDLIWAVRAGFRHMVVYSVHQRVTCETLAEPQAPGRLAYFVPAWDEATVIGAMLTNAVTALGKGDWRIYVGTYPNDAATIAQVAAVTDPRVRLVVGPRDGPTTKADCLNTMWRQMCSDELTEGPFKAVVLHDAEDVIDPCEPRIFQTLIERFDLVQLPVLPLVDRTSRWVAGHYIDEFVDQHAKTIVAREAIGAAVPSAGVGCAFARDMLARVAASRGGVPFDADSLTEDYELGLRIRELGGRGIFARIPVRTGGPLVAVRSHFPASLKTAVRQKARWTAGIALSGWDRLGWAGGVAERWMRLHDRRALLAALVLLAAYLALVANAVGSVLRALVDVPAPTATPALAVLLYACALLLAWRLAVRALLVGRFYGVGEAWRSIPRAVVGNIVAMMAARRAVGLYLRQRRDGVVRWDKTAHRFPAHVSAGLK